MRRSVGLAALMAVFVAIVTAFIVLRQPSSQTAVPRHHPDLRAPSTVLPVLGTPVSEPRPPSAHAVSAIPLGWYTTGLHTEEEVRSGMDLAVYLGSDPTWVERAAAQGVLVIAFPTPRFIQRFSGSPDIYAWYLTDEPDHNAITPAQLLHQYRALKRQDPAHPIAVTFTTDSLACRIAPGYWRAFDLLMYDEYPFYTDSGVSESVATVASHYRRCVSEARAHDKLGPIFILQGFGALHDGPFVWRYPSAAEEASLLRAAVKSGAQGVVWYVDNRAGATFAVVNHLIHRRKS
jgi:hypothetical protein